MSGIGKETVKNIRDIGDKEFIKICSLIKKTFHEKAFRRNHLGILTNLSFLMLYPYADAIPYSIFSVSRQKIRN
jgi:hypothetical protein